MHALILSDTPKTQLSLTVALTRQGIKVVNTETVEMARAYVRADHFDLLLLSERAHGRLAHPVALSAERHTPQVKTFLLSARTDEDVDELYELLPSLTGIIGTNVTPEVVAQLAQTAVDGTARPVKLTPKPAEKINVFSSLRKKDATNTPLILRPSMASKAQSAPPRAARA